jgi:hypothetical protein
VPETAHFFQLIEITNCDWAFLAVIAISPSAPIVQSTTVLTDAALSSNGRVCEQAPQELDAANCAASIESPCDRIPRREYLRFYSRLL